MEISFVKAHVKQTLIATMFIVASAALPVKAQLSGADTQNWRQWRIVGEAQLSWLFFDIYQSRLLTSTGRFEQGADVSPHPLALEINYLRDISQKDLLKATQQQWQKLGFAKAAQQRWIAVLSELFPDVQAGDSLTYLTDGQTGQLMFKRLAQSDYEVIGYVADEELNDAFLSIWLSPQSNYAQLRQQLIGQVSR